MIFSLNINLKLKSALRTRYLFYRTLHYKSTFLIRSWFVCQTLGELSILIVVCLGIDSIAVSLFTNRETAMLSTLEHRQLGSNICPGPKSPGPSCLGPDCLGHSWLGPNSPGAQLSGAQLSGANCPGPNLLKAVRVCVCANTEIQLLSLRPSGGVK